LASLGSILYQDPDLLLLDEPFKGTVDAESADRIYDFGKEIMYSATVIDAPPLNVCAVRAYIRTQYGLKALTEAWMKRTA
jgi:ABC-type Mn2+/Zn2+ transport system ATPase subunit